MRYKSFRLKLASKSSDRKYLLLKNKEHAYHFSATVFEYIYPYYTEKVQNRSQNIVDPLQLFNPPTLFRLHKINGKRYMLYPFNG